MSWRHVSRLGQDAELVAEGRGMPARYDVVSSVPGLWFSPGVVKRQLLAHVPKGSDGMFGAIIDNGSMSGIRIAVELSPSGCLSLT